MKRGLNIHWLLIKGIIEVKLQEDSDGYITYIGYPYDPVDHPKSPLSSTRSSPESSSSDTESPIVIRDKKKKDSDNDGG